MSYGFLIEDFLRLHLFECSYHYVNGYKGHSKAAIREMPLVKLIREFRAVYPKQRKFSEGLDKIRLIRNKLAHALVDQFGSDFESEEGRDQIHALLARTILHMRHYLKSLQRTHEAAVRLAIKDDWEKQSSHVVMSSSRRESLLARFSLYSMTLMDSPRPNQSLKPTASRRIA